MVFVVGIGGGGFCDGIWKVWCLWWELGGMVFVVGVGGCGVYDGIWRVWCLWWGVGGMTEFGGGYTGWNFRASHVYLNVVHYAVETYANKTV